MTPEIVPNWVDTATLCPGSTDERARARSALGISPKTFVLASIGGCSPVKNHWDAIEALKMLSDEGADVHYVHVGDGPSRDSERTMVQELGLSESFTDFGQTTHIREALLSADVFVMPSVYEGLGNTVIEAMCCGVPVVAYDVPGLRDLVTDRVNGLLVDATPGALAAAIRTLSGNPEMQARLGASGAEWAASTYAVAAGVASLAAIYGRTGRATG